MKIFRIMSRIQQSTPLSLAGHACHACLALAAGVDAK